MKAIAIIPARGGSRRIPLKNIQLFHGRPIIAYSIAKARESQLFNRIVVSTDSARIAAVAAGLGAEVHLRSDYHAQDFIGTQEVMSQVLRDMPGDEFHACCVYATAPLMRIADLKDGLRLLQENNQLHYVLSVGYPPLTDAGQFYWGHVSAFVSDAPLIGERTGMIHVPSEHVCDINTFTDWKRAETMFERNRA